MTSLYFEPSTRVKSYSAASRNGKSIVKIEIEVNDPRELGYLLADLAKMTAPKPRPPRRQQLLLEHRPGGGE